MNVVALRSVTPIAGLCRRRTAVLRGSRFSTIWPPPSRIGGRWNEANNLATPYQSYDFLKLWQRHVGAASGVTPFIVVAFNAVGTPLFLWPFGCRKLGGLRVVEFLGGKHANFNMALWRRDAAAKIGADDLRAVLSRLAGRADIVKLINQPLTWAGTTNPFALLPQQRSANFGFSGALVPDFEALLRARTNAAARKKMRKKERTLASYGAVRFERASGAHEVRRVLDAFFKQKARAHARSGHPGCFRRARRAALHRGGGDRACLPAASRRSNSTRSRSTTSSWRPWAALSAAGVSAPCSIRSRKAATRSKARASN